MDRSPIRLRSRISSKGQITVPKAIRERLGLYPGAEVEFDLADDAATLRRSPPSDLGIWKWVGYFQREGIDFPYQDSLDAVADMRGRGK